ncbi:MAG TPA: hypothetical protein VLM89_03210 [Phycisphaerae bacterium]|nr:hypothetical protein [Phycisphaerae bacterium]
MKTIDLSKGEHSLAEILKLAKSETVLIHAASGDDFLLEQADEFDREVIALGSSDKFMDFLKSRASEKEDISLDAARLKRGM